MACDNGQIVGQLPSSSTDLCSQLNACTDPATDDTPVLGPDSVVAPSDRLPMEVTAQAAHNNLDIVFHDGRLFFAYRTAPSHFASESTYLYVVSTTDHLSWRFEAALHEGTDLREPRFLSLNGSLYLFYARLGADRFTFEPGQARVIEYEGPGQWSAPQDIFPEGFIPWRISVQGQYAYLSGYTGGDAIYSTGEARLEVHWLKSQDGTSWSPVRNEPVILAGGVSRPPSSPRRMGLSSWLAMKRVMRAVSVPASAIYLTTKTQKHAVSTTQENTTLPCSFNIAGSST